MARMGREAKAMAWNRTDRAAKASASPRSR
jgi:hypothetical protein